LKNLNPEAQLKGILDIAERIRKTPGAHGGQRHEKEFLAYMGLPENLADYPGRIGELVAKIRGELGHMTEGQVAEGNKAAEAWQGLEARIGSLSDAIGSRLVPMLNSGYDSAAKFVAKLGELGTPDWISKIKVDPALKRDWDDLSGRLDADVKSLVGSFSSLENVKGVGSDVIDSVRTLVHGIDDAAKIIDALKKDRIDWSEVLGLSGFTAAANSFEKALQPGGVLHSIRAFFDALNAHAGIKPAEPIGRPNKGQPAHPATPTPRYETADPSMLIKHGAKSAADWIRNNWTHFQGPVHRPVTLTPAPRVALPPVAPPEPRAPFVFKRSDLPIDAPRVPKSMISPISYNPEGNPFRRPENPLQGQAPASPNTGDAINIIYQGTRRGVLDGMLDLIRQLRAEKKANASGVQSAASYETGDGAGGRGDGSGGDGAGRRRTGAGGLPDSPAGRIGHEIRRQRQDGGGGAGGSELPPGTGGPLLDEISKSEGTRGYNDAYAHQHPDVDLSKMTIDQVKALAMTQRGSGAIGRYQFMPKTLTGLEKELGLSGSEMFTPALQERLARSLLQRRGYDEWKAGKLSDQAFMHNLSKEWAGLTDPYTGRGYYPNQTTGHPLKQQFAALKS
jgi:muramidase (phage lysozyme)